MELFHIFLDSNIFNHEIAFKQNPPELIKMINLYLKVLFSNTF